MKLIEKIAKKLTYEQSLSREQKRREGAQRGKKYLTGAAAAVGAVHGGLLGSFAGEGVGLAGFRRFAERRIMKQQAKKGVIPKAAVPPKTTLSRIGKGLLKIKRVSPAGAKTSEQLIKRLVAASARRGAAAGAVGGGLTRRGHRKQEQKIQKRWEKKWGPYKQPK